MVLDGKMDEKLPLKVFTDKIGLPEGTVRNNIQSMIACDEIVIISMEYKE